MDPLSVTTGVISCLQVAASVLTLCYSLRAGMHKLPWSLIQVIDEVRDLRNIIESVESELNEEISLDSTESKQPADSRKLPESIKAALVTCLAELQSLESRVQPERVQNMLESKRKAFVELLAWRLQGSDVEESIFNLQRCKAVLILAISSHSSTMIRNIERLSISLNHKIDSSCHRLDSLAGDLHIARFDEHQKAVVDWLSPLKPGQAHDEAKTAHQPGTSQWFLEGSDFKERLVGKERILWLSGPPGSGKTVLMSHAIDRIARGNTQFGVEPIYAFAYCSFRDADTQDVVKVLGAILAQLCAQLKHFPDEILRVHRASTKQGRGEPPPIKLISESIRVLAIKRRMYIFVDGIDEVADRKSLAQHLVDLTGPACRIHIIAASRHDAAVHRIFEDDRCISLEDHTSEVDEDIERYTADRLSCDPDLDWLSADLQKFVADSLLSKSKGSFRWAACQLDSLSRCMTIRDIKRSLRELPYGLNETYGRTLERVTHSDALLVRKMLTWLAYSAVPITLHQLWEALAIEEGSDCINDEARLRSPQDVVNLGNSLVTVSSDGYVMLAHLSVRDYLVSTEISKNAGAARFALQPTSSHNYLAQDCLTYLSFLRLASGPSGSQEGYLSRLEQMPLLNYVAKYWFYHTRNAEHSEKLRDLATRFFYRESRPNFMSWVQILNADMPFKWNIFPRHATSLYYAASLGLDDVVESLLRTATQTEVNAPGSRFGGTALHAAVLRGHIAIAERLIARGSDPGKVDFNNVTPLHSAASQGYMDAIKILVSSGAPTDVRNDLDGKTPAEWARLSGYVAAAELIEEGPTRDIPNQDLKIGTGDKSADRSCLEAQSRGAEICSYEQATFPTSMREDLAGLDPSLVTSIVIDKEASHFDSTLMRKKAAATFEWTTSFRGSGCDGQTLRSGKRPVTHYSLSANAYVLG